MLLVMLLGFVHEAWAEDANQLHAKLSTTESYTEKDGVMIFTARPGDSKQFNSPSLTVYGNDESNVLTEGTDYTLTYSVNGHTVEQGSSYYLDSKGNFSTSWTGGSSIWWTGDNPRKLAISTNSQEENNTVKIEVVPVDKSKYTGTTVSYKVVVQKTTLGAEWVVGNTPCDDQKTWSYKFFTDDNYTTAFDGPKIKVTKDGTEITESNSWNGYSVSYSMDGGTVTSSDGNYTDGVTGIKLDKNGTVTLPPKEKAKPGTVTITETVTPGGGISTGYNGTSLSYTITISYPMDKVTISDANFTDGKTYEVEAGTKFEAPKVTEITEIKDASEASTLNNYHISYSIGGVEAVDGTPSQDNTTRSFVTSNGDVTIGDNIGRFKVTISVVPNPSFSTSKGSHTYSYTVNVYEYRASFKEVEGGTVPDSKTDNNWKYTLSSDKDGNYGSFVAPSVIVKKFGVDESGKNYTDVVDASKYKVAQTLADYSTETKMNGSELQLGNGSGKFTVTETVTPAENSNITNIRNTPLTYDVTMQKISYETILQVAGKTLDKGKGDKYTVTADAMDFDKPVVVVNKVTTVGVSVTRTPVEITKYEYSMDGVTATGGKYTDETTGSTLTSDGKFTIGNNDDGSFTVNVTATAADETYEISYTVTVSKIAYSVELEKGNTVPRSESDWTYDLVPGDTFDGPNVVVKKTSGSGDNKAETVVPSSNYTLLYSKDNAPDGVTIDSETGSLTIGSDVNAGTTFTVNIEVSKSKNSGIVGDLSKTLSYKVNVKSSASATVKYDGDDDVTTTTDETTKEPTFIVTTYSGIEKTITPTLSGVSSENNDITYSIENGTSYTKDGTTYSQDVATGSYINPATGELTIGSVGKFAVDVTITPKTRAKSRKSRGDGSTVLTYYVKVQMVSYVASLEQVEGTNNAIVDDNGNLSFDVFKGMTSLQEPVVKVMKHTYDGDKTTVNEEIEATKGTDYTLSYSIADDKTGSSIDKTTGDLTIGTTSEGSFKVNIKVIPTDAAKFSSVINSPLTYTVNVKEYAAIFDKGYDGEIYDVDLTPTSPFDAPKVAYLNETAEKDFSTKGYTANYSIDGNNDTGSTIDATTGALTIGDYNGSFTVKATVSDKDNQVLATLTYKVNVTGGKDKVVIVLHSTTQPPTSIDKQTGIWTYNVIPGQAKFPKPTVSVYAKSSYDAVGDNATNLNNDFNITFKVDGKADTDTAHNAFGQVIFADVTTGTTVSQLAGDIVVGTKHGTVQVDITATPKDDSKYEEGTLHYNIVVKQVEAVTTVNPTGLTVMVSHTKKVSDANSSLYDHTFKSGLDTKLPVVTVATKTEQTQTSQDLTGEFNISYDFTSTKSTGDNYTPDGNSNLKLSSDGNHFSYEEYVFNQTVDATVTPSAKRDSEGNPTEDNGKQYIIITLTPKVKDAYSVIHKVVPVTIQERSAATTGKVTVNTDMKKFFTEYNKYLKDSLSVSNPNLYKELIAEDKNESFTGKPKESKGDENYTGYTAEGHTIHTYRYPANLRIYPESYQTKHRYLPEVTTVDGNGNDISDKVDYFFFVAEDGFGYAKDTTNNDGITARSDGYGSYFKSDFYNPDYSQQAGRSVFHDNGAGGIYNGYTRGGGVTGHIQAGGSSSGIPGRVRIGVFAYISANDVSTGNYSDYDLKPFAFPKAYPVRYDNYHWEDEKNPDNNTSYRLGNICYFDLDIHQIVPYISITPNPESRPIGTGEQITYDDMFHVTGVNHNGELGTIVITSDSLKYIPSYDKNGNIIGWGNQNGFYYAFAYPAFLDEDYNGTYHQEGVDCGQEKAIFKIEDYNNDALKDLAKHFKLDTDGVYIYEAPYTYKDKAGTEYTKTVHWIRRITSLGYGNQKDWKITFSSPGNWPMWYTALSSNGQKWDGGSSNTKVFNFNVTPKRPTRIVVNPVHNTAGVGEKDFTEPISTVRDNNNNNLTSYYELYYSIVDDGGTGAKLVAKGGGTLRKDKNGREYATNLYDIDLSGTTREGTVTVLVTGHMLPGYLSDKRYNIYQETPTPALYYIHIGNYKPLSDLLEVVHAKDASGNPAPWSDKMGKLHMIGAGTQPYGFMIHQVPGIDLRFGEYNMNDTVHKWTFKEASYSTNLSYDNDHDGTKSALTNYVITSDGAVNVYEADGRITGPFVEITPYVNGYLHLDGWIKRDRQYIMLPKDNKTGKFDMANRRVFYYPSTGDRSFNSDFYGEQATLGTPLVVGKTYYFYCADGNDFVFHGLWYQPAYVSDASTQEYVNIDYNATKKGYDISGRNLLVGTTYNNGFSSSLPKLYEAGTTDSRLSFEAYKQSDAFSSALKDKKYDDMWSDLQSSDAFAVPSETVDVDANGEVKPKSESTVDPEGSIIRAKVMPSENVANKDEKNHPENADDVYKYAVYVIKISGMPTYRIVDADAAFIKEGSHSDSREVAHNAGDIVSTTNYPTNIKMMYGGWTGDLGKADGKADHYATPNKKAQVGTSDADIEKYSKYLDGFEWSIEPSSNNSMDENRAGYQSYNWYNKENTALDKNNNPVPFRTSFSLPRFGNFVRFEPTEPGTLFVYIVQDGVCNYSGSNPGALNSTQLVWKPLYIVDESGRPAKMVSDTKLSGVSDLLTVGSNQGSYTEGLIRAAFNDKDIKNVVQNGATWTNTDSKGRVTTGQYKVIGEWADKSTGTCSYDWSKFENAHLFHDNSSLANTELAIKNGWAGKKVGDQEDPIRVSSGAYTIINKAYMRYGIEVKAGKTYFVFMNGSKFRLCGFAFVPNGWSMDNIHGNAYTSGEDPGLCSGGYKAPNISANKPIDIELWYTDTDKSGNKTKSFADVMVDSKYDHIANVTLKNRNLKNKTWASICLPFSVSESRFKQVFGNNAFAVSYDYVAKMNTGGSLMHFTQHGYRMLEAGRPYFIYPDYNKDADGNAPAVKEDLVFDSVTIEKNYINENLNLNESMLSDDYTKNMYKTDTDHSKWYSECPIGPTEPRLTTVTNDYIMRGTYDACHMKPSSFGISSSGKLTQTSPKNEVSIKRYSAWLESNVESAEKETGKTTAKGANVKFYSAAKSLGSHTTASVPSTLDPAVLALLKARADSIKGVTYSDVLTKENVTTDGSGKNHVNPVGKQITMTNGGYSTFCSEVNVDFTEWEKAGIKAYAATGYGNGVLTLTKVSNIPATEGVVLKSTADATVTVSLAASPGHMLNLLRGVMSDSTLTQRPTASQTNFYLTKGDDGEFNFYRVGAKGQPISAGKAYLPLPNSWLSNPSSAKGLSVKFVDDGVVTDIININADQMDSNDNEVYDLQGRKVDEMQEGVYIVNGKKVIRR